MHRHLALPLTLVALLACNSSLALSDADSDGVDDSRDRCPGTLSGAVVDSTGCEADHDRDGVVDRVDNCQGTRAGALVTTRGCEHDSDGDGIVDRSDRCPNSPAGARIDGVGCPFENLLSLRGLGFETGSTRPTRASHQIIREAAQTLNRYPELTVEVEGHTDNRGAAGHNLKLSRQRANAVLEMLVRFGVTRARLKAVGYGELQPVADNKTADGRETNRRVDLRLYD